MAEPTAPDGARVEVLAPAGIGEVAAGDDLVALVLRHLRPRDGDVVLLTSKVVAKAEGRVVRLERDLAVDQEAGRVVARRGRTRIVRTRHGLTMAAAGVDDSNVAPGSVVLLPLDPDASARGVRHGLHERAGLAVAVVITDTAGRAWREGQTDIAVGAAGLRVLDDHAGRRDPHGNLLAVTAPAVADEIAGAAELAQSKLGGRPLALLRGRADLVLPSDDDGPGARALVRSPQRDMFGYGAREAVLAALLDDEPADHLADGFGGPAPVDDLLAALRRLGAGDAVAGVADDELTLRTSDSPVPAQVLRAVVRALGWRWDAAADTSAGTAADTPAEARAPGEVRVSAPSP